MVKLSQMLETTEADENYKKIARHKLDAMLALCETGGCRRKSLLNYFGQNADEQCDFCDTCIEPPVLWDATVDAQKMLSAIYRTRQMFGAGHVIDVLRGSKSAKIAEREHDRLSVYGIGKDQSKEHWNTVLRQLLSLDFVAIKNWEYRTLGLTAKCDEILKSGKKLELRKQRLSINHNKIKSKKGSSSPKESDVSHGRTALFNALKALRYRIAQENKVPPYIVFSDKTLHEMCMLLPRNSSDLLMVSGVGQTKQEKYGELFLRKISEFND
jgi:ATP-dependent DNA helicase RecQ